MPSVNSKSRSANKLSNVQNEWAATLIDLRLKVEGSWFKNMEPNYRKKWFGGIIIGWNLEKGMWKIKMDYKQTLVYLMQYDTVLKYVNEDAVNFDTFQLPADPVSLPNPTGRAGENLYRMTKDIDWTQIFEDTEYPSIPILPLPFEGDQEEFGVNITDAELEGLKDSNGVLICEKLWNGAFHNLMMTMARRLVYLNDKDNK